MAKLLTLVAKEPLEYQGQAIATGEVFAGTLRQTARWIYKRKVSMAPNGALATRDLTASDESVSVHPAKRHYRRRDLRAEP